MQVAESSLNLVQASGAVGVSTDVQEYISSSWQSLVDLQAHSNYLLFNAIGANRPIGTGTGSNPEPNPFDAALPFAELKGVPGVGTGMLSTLTSAVLTDGCPFLTSITERTLSQCYSDAGGPQHGGLLGATTSFLSLGQALTQAKADQLAAAQVANVLTPTSGLGYSVAAAYNSDAVSAYRALGGRFLAPAYAYMVSSCDFLNSLTTTAHSYSRALQIRSLPPLFNRHMFYLEFRSG